MGIACSGTSELVFEDMTVPAANLLHTEGQGFKWPATLDGGRVGIALRPRHCTAA